MSRPRLSDDERRRRLEFEQTMRVGECWIWCAGQNGVGYGMINIRGKNELIHRYSYRLFVGPLQEGMDIDHLCSVRLCCNPKHLEQVTRSENVKRSYARNRK